MSNPSKPLEGIRVVELARVLAGPWAGQLLADLGADVIKVESPNGGDETRHWGPPFVDSASGDKSAAYFHSANRGKRSVALNLKNPKHLEVLKKLINDADVLIENFKVGGLSKFGLDYASAAKRNPKLVYCSITGFGQTGPYANHAGYDFIIQGMSGFMSITGEADGEPQKAGVAITDILTGLYAVSAINATLIQALKTGNGCHIDLSLFEVMSASLANQNLNFLATGNAPSRLGNQHPNIAPYQVLQAFDQPIIFAVGNDAQFAKMTTILNCHELASDDRFSTNQARVENREALTIALTERTQNWRGADLVSACETAGVPAGPINTIADMFADEQMIARGFQVQTSDGVSSTRAPFLINGTAPTNLKSSPALGADTDAILSSIKDGWPASG